MNCHCCNNQLDESLLKANKYRCYYCDSQQSKESVMVNITLMVSLLVLIFVGTVFGILFAL